MFDQYIHFSLKIVGFNKNKNETKNWFFEVSRFA